MLISLNFQYSNLLATSNNFQNNSNSQNTITKEVKEDLGIPKE